jgi:hypothetical protein
MRDETIYTTIEDAADALQPGEAQFVHQVFTPDRQPLGYVVARSKTFALDIVARVLGYNASKVTDLQSIISEHGRRRR